MAFHPRRAYAVFWKDTLDLTLNRALLASMAALPAMLVVVPVLMVWAYFHKVDPTSLRLMAQFYDPTVDPKSSPLFLARNTLSIWFGLFLVMPVFVPVLISSQSVAGEKERRTLEPLLASPLTGPEMVAGKSLASLLPAVVLTYLAYGALCLGVDLVTYPFVHELVLPDTLWTVGVVILAPLFAFFGNGIAVLISARVGDARLAQQLSALFVLPLIGIAGVQLAGKLSSGLHAYLVEGAVVGAADLLLVWASVRVLDRERLLSRWT